MRISQYLSDQTIALAYFSIPIWFMFSARARRLLVNANGLTWMFVLFGLFILSCGLGHEIDAIYAFRGQCAAFSTVKSVCNWSTAILSSACAIVLLPKVATYAGIGFKRA